MTVSPFDHPLLSALVGDETAAHAFSLEAEMAALLEFERALAEAEAVAGVIEPQAAEAIRAGIAAFRPDFAGLSSGVAKDGMAVPELVRQLRAAIAPQWRDRLHFGATSQDAIDTALVLRLKPVVGRFGAQIDALVADFADLAGRFGERPLMGVTRMQEAIPIRAGDRIAAWRQPLERHRARLAEVSERLLVVQFGGAAGTLEKLGDKAGAVRAALAAKLGLGDAPQWHSQRDRIVDFGNWLALVTGSLGKFGQDIALMALRGDEIRLSGGGGSSAMPHKQNPVAAEALAALARFNATQVAGLQQAMLHEQERSGAAWTLEWLLLPQMVVATVAALTLALRLAGQIESVGG